MDDQAPSPDPRLADAELLGNPQASSLIERAQAHIDAARELMAEYHRVAGIDGGDGPEKPPHVIIRKDPGRGMRTKLNSVETPAGDDDDAADRPGEGLPS